MKYEVDPRTTTRARAFDLWMEAPMPMVTQMATLRVTRALRRARREGLKFNMLMLWCVGRAASGIGEFFLLPEGRRMMRYDALAVNTIVADSGGGVSSCDVPFTDDLAAFNADYLRLTERVRASRTDHDLSSDRMVIGTSALTRCAINGAVGIYSGIFNNPFLIWGRYRRRWLAATLPVSFQFHHTQMDGAHAARFLEALQREIDGL